MAPARGAVRAGRDQAAADQVRPHGASRAPGAVTPKIVGDEPGMVPLSDLRVMVGRTVLTSTGGVPVNAAQAA